MTIQLAHWFLRLIFELRNLGDHIQASGLVRVSVAEL